MNNYANIAWASTHKSKLLGLYRHQKHAIRVIHHKDRYTHAKPLFRNIKALSVFQINIFQTLCFTFRCKHKILPKIFHGIFTLKAPNKYTLRTADSLFEPPCRTKISQYWINYRGPHFWNKLQSDKKEITSLEFLPLFRKKLKDFSSQFF